MKTPLFVLLIFLFAISCSKDSPKEKSHSITIVDNGVAYSYAPPPPPPPSPFELNEGPKLVKTGELTIKTTEIENTKNKLRTILFQCNGNVKYERLSNYDGQSEYSLLFDVPVSKFERFIYKLDSLKLNVTEKTYRVTDVTLRYVDETSRLKNKKKLEQTYLDLLSKAESINNIIEIQGKIEAIRADIESKEEQLKALDNQIAYSEFSIKVETPQTVNKKETENIPTAKDKFKKAIKTGSTGVIDSLAFLVSIWPIYLIIGLLYLLFRIVRKRSRNRKRDKMAEL
jgi:hypothetical protein